MGTVEKQTNASRAEVVSFLMVLIIGLVVAFASCVFYHYLPPTKDQAGFSTDNARQHLESFVDQRPRVIGTPKHAETREFIVKQLQDWGYAVELQLGKSPVNSRLRERSEDRSEVPLTNILAGKSLAPGQTKKLLLVAHYDSVPFGPGASDNGVGVAAMLEIAKLIKDQPLEKRDILFLFPDGEELGLLGAKLFADQHPLMDEIGLVINVDARGTQGPSLMFETGADTQRLIPVFAKTSERPYASSLFGEIYKRLPNDTDFSVFKRRKLHGFNFAFIGNVRNYHTPADSLENVSEASFQHHGENIYGLVKELSRAESDALFDKTDATEPSSVVYFDVLGSKLFWWSEGNARVAALVTLLIWICCAMGIAVRLKKWRRRDGLEVATDQSADVGEVCRSLVGLLGQSLVTLLGVSGTVWIVLWLIARDAVIGAPWPDGAIMIHAAIWLIGLATASGIGACFAKSNHCSTLIQWGIVAGGWVGVLVLTAYWGPGASYLFQVPLAVGLPMLLIGLFNPKPMVVSGLSVIWMAGVMAVWLPLEPLFYDALGFKMKVANAVRIALLVTSMLPLVSGLSRAALAKVALWSAAGAVVTILIAKFASA